MKRTLDQETSSNIDRSSDSIAILTGGLKQVLNTTKITTTKRVTHRWGSHRIDLSEKHPSTVAVDTRADI